LVVINDRKNQVLELNTDYYEPTVISAQDYFPFGQEMGSYRSFSASSSYRYGFNGKEKDQDGEWGSTTRYDYGARIYNPSLGRFLSLDPKSNLYPSISAYGNVDNNPIRFVDIDGRVITIPDGSGGFVVYEEGMKADGYSEVTTKYINELNHVNSGKSGSRIKVLSKSDVVFNVQIGTAEEVGLKKGGATMYNFEKERVDIKVVDSGLSNIAILGDEFTHAEQFENGEMGFIKIGDNEGAAGYDFGDEFESKEGAVDALKQNGLTATDVDPNGEFESTELMKLIEKGEDKPKNIRDWIKTTKKYKGFFGKNANKDARVSAKEGVAKYKADESVRMEKGEVIKE